MEEKNIQNMTQEEFEQLEVSQEEQTIDDRLVELEMEKEISRIDKEIWFDENNKSRILCKDKKFIEGLQEGAYFAGFVTALINAGVSMNDAFTLAYNRQTLQFNQEMGKLDLEKAKHIGVQAQGQII